METSYQPPQQVKVNTFEGLRIEGVEFGKRGHGKGSKKIMVKIGPIRFRHLAVSRRAGDGHVMCCRGRIVGATVTTHDFGHTKVHFHIETWEQARDRKVTSFTGANS